MKFRELTEIHYESYTEEEKEMHRWCQSLSMNYQIFHTKDKQLQLVAKGVIDLGFKSIEELPYKFLRITGDLSLGPNKHLKSFKNFPSFSTSIDISNTGITSLIGINDEVKFTRSFYAHNCEIKEGGLGLVLIDELQTLECNRTAPHAAAFEIIEKYIGKPHLIYDCQAELLDAGLEEYAKL